MARSPALRVPLRWRVMLLLLLLATLNVAFTVLTRSEIAEVTELDRVGARLDAATRIEERQQSARDDQALSIRAYALTGDEAFLADYRTHVRAEARRQQQLAELLQEEPELREQAARASDAMAAWREQLAEPVIEAAPEERAQVAAGLVAEVGDPLFDDVREYVDQLVAALDSRQQETTSAVREARAQLNRELLAMSVLTLMLIAASVWALRQWITVPVATLSSQARRIAGGDLDAHIDAVGPVEFEEIGNDMERMRRRIVNELRATTQAFEALEQRAPLVSGMREQLHSRTATELPEGLHLTATLEPAHGVLAGDWHDVVRVDEDRVAVVLVDVSGHGEEAGLRALWLKHLLVPAVRMGLEPGDALNWVAGQVGDTAEWFATCVILEVDVSTGECDYANAGHLPPLLFGAAGVEELPVTGPLFGPLPGSHWDTGRVTLEPGQALVAFTDGITEARNAAGEEFGDERLISCIVDADLSDTRTLAEDVMNSVHGFSSERLKDDATLAVIAYTRTGHSSEAPRDDDRFNVV